MMTTVGDGGRFVAFELGVPPAWIVGELAPGWLGLVDVSRPPFPVGALLLVAAGAVAVWRREADALRLVVLAAGATVAGIVAVSRFADGIFPYLTQWSPVVGLVVWLAIAWTVEVLGGPALRPPARLRPLTQNKVYLVLGIVATVFMVARNLT